LAFRVSDKLQFVVTSLGVQALRILTTFVMARLLSPRDYGVVTLVVAIPAILGDLGDLGVMRALIQIRDEPLEQLEDTGLVMTALVNCVYFALSISGGLYLSHKLHDRRLVPLGIITGFTNYVGSIYNFQLTILNRALRFRAESFQNIIFAIAQSATGIGLALSGWGVFALALQPLAAQAVANAAMSRHHRLRWPRQFRLTLARRMLNYGWRVTLAQYANNARVTFVNLVVGYRAGASGLGIYGKAGQIKDLIAHNIIVSLDRLFNPTMTGVREDQARLQNLFVRGCAAIALISWFGWAWFTATSPDLIRVLLGPQWNAASPLLRIMAVELMTVPMAVMAVAVVHVIGAPLVWLRFTVSSAVVLVPAVLIAAHLGMMTIAAAVVFSQSILTITLFRWALGYLKISWIAVIRRLGMLCAASVISFAVMCWLGWGPLVASRPLIRLAVESAVGGIVFLAFVLTADSQTFREIRQLIWEPQPATAIEPPEQQQTWP